MTIGEAAAAHGVSTHTLRYWEQEGLIPPVARGASGRREFTDEDLAWIRYAACLRGMGMGIRDIAEYVRAATTNGAAATQRKLLESHVERMRAQRAELDYFIGVAERKLSHLS